MSVMCQRAVVAKYLAVVDAVGLDGDSQAFSLIERGEDCFKLLSVDGTLEFVNGSGMGLVKSDHPEPVLQRLWWDLWPPDCRSFVREKFDAAAQGLSVVFNAVCPSEKGDDCYWCINLKPLISNSGPVVSVMVTSRAIPFRKEA